MRIVDPPHVYHAKRDPDHCPVCRAVVEGISEYSIEGRGGTLYNFCSMKCQQKAAYIEWEYDEFAEDAYQDMQYQLWRDGEL